MLNEKLNKFQHNPNCTIPTERVHKCYGCGTLTNNLDYCAEVYFCSIECQKKFDKYCDEKIKLYFK